MNDAVHPATPPAAPAPAPRRRVWPWVLLGLIGLVTALVVLAIVGAVATIDDWGGGNVSISIDDETIVLPQLHGGALVAALLGLAVALMLALVLVPLVLLAAFGAVGLALVCALVAAATFAAIALARVPLVWVILGLGPLACAFAWRRLRA